MVRVETDPVKRNSRVDPDLTDEVIGFGAYVLGTGRANLAGADLNKDRSTAPVVKRLVRTADNRVLLIEAVEYPSIRGELDLLPRKLTSFVPIQYRTPTALHANIPRVTTTVNETERKTAHI